LTLFSINLKNPGIYRTESADQSEKPRDEKKYAEFLDSIDNYRNLISSPYFNKITYNDNRNINNEILIGKHSIFGTNLVSWVAPISVLRFKNIGNTSFDLPGKKKSFVKITSKESYTITDKLIKFM